MAGWDLETLRQVQEKLRSRVRIESDFGPLHTVGGVDASYLRRQKKIVVAMVVLEIETLRPIERVIWEGPVTFPYIPTFLSFRELPGMLAAYDQLVHKPDLLLVDGQGIAHPRGLGIAAHLGVELDLPTIGCAKSRLVGEYEPVCPDRGCASPLVHQGRQVGWVVRTRACVRPIFVSPGHRVSLEDALKIVLKVSPRYRIPEPIRHADHLSRQRVKELQQTLQLSIARTPSSQSFPGEEP